MTPRLVGFFYLTKVGDNVDKVRIAGVKKDSIAEEIGLQAGDYILSFNGEKIVDILDYKFNEAEEEITLTIEHKNGQIEIYEIEKEEYDELGIEFESELIDKPHSCRNQCIFCFMEQLPPKVRKTLIFKDDDYRLSFFTGNYITMTNMKEEDIDRIIRYRISPINISIHATDEAVRCRMLNNRFAGKVLRYLDKLYEAGIAMNTQIVLCKGINDGKILENTIQDLSRYGECMKSICIVPVGLSKFRTGKYPLEPLDKQDARQTIEIVEKYQQQLKKKYHTRMVYVADELYLKAGKEIPDYKAYEDFNQLENGVGMLALFEHEWKSAMQKLEKKMHTKKHQQYLMNKKQITVVTGKITEAFVKHKVQLLQEKLPSMQVEVVGIENYYFGHNITVTGLVTGTDIITCLLQKKEEGMELGDYLIIPSVMLKEDEPIFLDDCRLEEVQKQLQIPVVVSDTSAQAFVQSMTQEVPIEDISYVYDKNYISGSYENSIYQS